MADEKLNTGPGEEKLPEAPAPEQTAAPTPQQEGPAQPEPPFLFIFSRNDAVSLLIAAAKGGSRHEAHTVSTKSDGH